MSITNNDFYKFIAKMGGILNLDTDGNQTVTKYEFKKAVESNWNGEETPSEDVISRFWRTLDTNVSSDKIKGTSLQNLNALDDKEIEALGEKTKIYQALDTYMKGLRSAFSEINSYAPDWLNGVEDTLIDLIESTYVNGNKKFDSKIFEADGEWEQKNVLSTAGSTLVGYARIAIEKSTEYRKLDIPSDYELTEDETLMGLLNTYYEEVGSNVTSRETLKNLWKGAQAVINAYLAASGLDAKVPNNLDLNLNGQDDDNTNPSEWIKDKYSVGDLNNSGSVDKTSLWFKNVTTQLKDTYNSWYNDLNDDFLKNLFNTAIESYLSNIYLPSVSGETDVKKIISGLTKENFEKKSNFDEAKTQYNKYMNLTSDNGIYEKIANISEEIADKLIDKDLGAIYRQETGYNDIVRDVVSKIYSGELKNEKTAIEDYITMQIKMNIDKYLSNGGTIDEYFIIYETRFKAAESTPSTALNKIKEAAIDFCNQISALGEDYQKLIEEKCPNGVSDKINSFNRSDLVNNFILEIKEAADKILVGVGTENYEIADNDEAVINALKNSSVVINASTDAKIKDKAKIAAKYGDYLDDNYSITVSKLMKISVEPTYYVDINGDVQFVLYDSDYGPFDDTKDSILNTFFDQVKKQLETTYETELNQIAINDTQKDRLFEMALLYTLQNSVTTMYNSFNIATLTDKVVENYRLMLEQIGSDNTIAKAYLDKSADRSLLNGRVASTEGEDVADKIYKKEAETFRYMNFANNSTSNDDDWVPIKEGVDSCKWNETTYTDKVDSTITGSILTVTSKGEADSKILNGALTDCLAEYIANYREFVEPNRIIELFKKAEEIAFANLSDLTTYQVAGDAKVYGYGENGAYDGQNCDFFDKNQKYVSVGAIILNVMHEMEYLLAMEVFSFSK